MHKSYVGAFWKFMVSAVFYEEPCPKATSCGGLREEVAGHGTSLPEQRCGYNGLGLVSGARPLMPGVCRQKLNYAA